ncbi:MAG: hypothetical protein AB7T49_05155 [Oligoflexales bacterium]
MVIRGILTTGFVSFLFVASGCTKSHSGSRGCGKSDTRCNSLKAEADEFRSLREEALESHKYTDAVQYTVEYNQRLELIEAYRQGAEGRREAQDVDAEYNRMKEILKHDLDELRAEGESSERKDQINQCKQDDERETDRCVQIRESQTQIREVEDFYKSETSASEEESPSSAATSLELKYLYLKLFEHAEDAQNAGQQLSSDYERLWEILQQIDFEKKPNGALPGMICAPEYETRCRETEEDIVRLRAERKASLENQDPNSIDNVRKIDLEVNYKLELLDTLRGDEPVDPKTIADLEKSYEQLKALLDQQQGFRPYSASESKAVAQVFEEYGALYIKPSDKDQNGRSIPEEVKAKTGMPWSGYWYPKRKDDLFGKPESPLAKLDRVASAIDRNAPLESAAWEFSRYSPDDADWAGLCDAWALASIRTPEPKTPIKFANVTFSISDQKALLIKKHEGYQAKIYGNRYYGSHVTDGEIQDLRPEAFHRIVQEVIGVKSQAIVIDEDPGPEVWSRPLFRVRWTIDKDITRENAYVVKAWPYLVKNRVSIEENPTNPTDLKAPVYEYRFYVNNKDQQDGKARVIYGEWIGTSLSEHPDIVFLPQNGDAGLSPINPEVAKGLKLIDRIFAEGTPVN